MKAQRRDDNEREIVEFLRGNGWTVRYCDKSEGHDLDVSRADRGSTILFRVEVKNPHQPPSKRRLTENEALFKAKTEREGGKYWILLSIRDAALMIGVPYPEKLF